MLPSNGITYKCNQATIWQSKGILFEILIIPVIRWPLEVVKTLVCAGRRRDLANILIVHSVDIETSSEQHDGAFGL